MNKAVFLDRDGTINLDREGYISNPQDLELFCFAAEAIKRLNILGYLVIVVTNQSGIARGYYTIEELSHVHEKMEKELKAGGASLDGILFSPWHKEGIVEPYNCDHEDRKPGIGMFNKACTMFDIDPKKSFIIGDRESDIGFGTNAGIKSILVKTGLGEEEFLKKNQHWIYKPDFVTDNLLSAVDLLEFMEGRNK